MYEYWKAIVQYLEDASEIIYIQLVFCYIQDFHEVEIHSTSLRDFQGENLAIE